MESETNTAFRPTDEMKNVVEEIQRQIEAAEVGVFNLPNPKACCAMLGIPPSVWDEWTETYGDTFGIWFVAALQPTKIERGLIDAMFWKTLRRIINGPSPNAAHLKLAAELGGHLKERPEPPPIPYLTQEEALDVLRKLGPEVLEMALEGAEEDETTRRKTAGKTTD